MELVRVVFALRATTEAGVRVGRLAPTSVCRRAFAFKTSSYALRAAEDRSSCAKARLHPGPSGLTRYARHGTPLRGTQKSTETEVASVGPALDGRLGIRPEVHKKPKASLRETEIV